MVWVVRKTVAPAARRAWINSLMTRAFTGSSPEVGSSRKSSGGLCSRARATLRRFCIPLENWATGSRPAAPKPTRSSASCGVSAGWR